MTRKLLLCLSVVAASLTAGWCAAGSERNLNPTIRLECVGLDAATGEYFTIGDVAPPQPAPPQPAPPTPIVGPTPVVPAIPVEIATAVAQCESDKAAIAKAESDLAAEQAAAATIQKEIQAATTTLASHQGKLAADTASMMTLLAKLYPVVVSPPTPTPEPAPKPPTPEPPASGVVLVQISSNTCPWCKGAEAVADTLKAAGLSVTKFNSDQDTAVKAKYKPLQFPTWVVENNGVEVNRATGSMTAAALREWVESNRKFIENDGRQ